MTSPVWRLRVVVVDDYPDAANSLASLLQALGCEARAAHHGQSALDLARADPPDFIISDINMPLMNGYELAAAVRADPALARVRLVAHSATLDGRARATEAGFDHVLVKPVGLAELTEVLTMIEQVKELARETRELAGETRDLIREVKQEVKELRDDVREVKQEVRELKDGRGEESFR